MPPSEVLKSSLSRGESGGNERLRSITERIGRLPEHERDVVIEALIDINRRHDPEAVGRLEDFLKQRGVSEPRGSSNEAARTRGPETRTAYETKGAGVSEFRNALRRAILLDES